ncbi:MAG: serine hydrolase domain-containing protein [Chloroflexota bacterium]
MKKFLIGLVTLIGIVVLGGVALIFAANYYALETVSTPHQVNSVDEMDAFFEQLTASNNPPGINVVVLKDGSVVYDKGFGVADGPNNVPVTNDTIYGWFSITKIPTAIAILQLHEQRLLDIDDPVSQYLPFFDVTYPSPDSPEITIRQVLNHSSGLPNNLPDVAFWIHPEDVPPYDQTAFLEEKFDKFSTLIFEPGDHAAYTNFGYSVLGSVIESVSGMGYEDYVRSHILTPLQMDSTDFIYREDMRADAAVASHEIGNELTLFVPFVFPGIVRDWDFDNHLLWFNKFYAHSSPPTGLIGPANEMSRIIGVMLNEGEVDGARILQPETVALMIYESHAIAEGPDAEPNEYRGLGWHVNQNDGRTYWGHSGGGAGFATTTRFYADEGLGIVVFANGTDLDRAGILDMISRVNW